MQQTHHGELIRIQITNLIKFSDSFAGVEVYLLVTSKFVKLNYATENFIDILRRLQQKEVLEVYLKPEDCSRILMKIQESMSAKNFYDPKTVASERVEIVNNSMAMIKNVINQMGVNVENLRLLKTVNQRAMELLNESPSLYGFISKFKKNCSDEFLRSTLTSYLVSLIIDKFDWRSDLVKEKGALASMLCDMVLERNDFLEYRSALKAGEAVPERLRTHPLEVAQILRSRRGLIPAETITIIEQHHELPNGKGFPMGITSTRFNQLSCIFILSQQFIELLFQEDFNYGKRLEIVSKLRHTYESKSFEKSLEALTGVVA